MNIEKRLDEICDKLDTTPLSAILPLLLPIALEFEDYSGYCILKFWSNTFGGDKKIASMLRKGIQDSLVLEGLTEGESEEIVKDALEYYIALRSVDDNNCMVYSAKEMENRFKMLDDTINELTPPQGLHPTDLYFYSTSSNNIKFSIRQEKTTLEKQYATLHSYITGKISEYMQKNSLKEREKVMETKEQDFKNIFIIHGHDGELKERLARKVERQDLDAIILNERVNRGKTIIEKIEKYSDVKAAICLFTADDLGKAKDETVYNKRARQNVVFEAGYFIGKLGRENVIIVADEDLEIPSDLSGVVYTSSKNWETDVFRELRDIGYSIDFNKLYD